MARRANSHVNPSDFIDSAGTDAAVRHAGGPSPRLSYSFGGSSYDSQLLAAVYGRDPRERAIADIYELNDAQKRRPHCFVKKLRGRAVKPFLLDPYEPKPSLISVEEFASQYDAAQFAASCGLFCDVSVTIHWGLLGCHDAKAVKPGFRAFQMCLDNWLKNRGLERAYFYAHESGPDAGLHTHLQVHVPADAPDEPSCRKDFREWAQRIWVQNRMKVHVPKAVKVSYGRKACLMRHWIGFHYQMKGYDPEACVVTRQNSEDGQAVMLGDLVAFPWRNPGSVPLLKRVGCSELLGEASRQSGRPGGHDVATSQSAGPRKTISIDIGGMMCTASLAHVPAAQWRPEDEPFQSAFNAGWRDVWKLYGEKFAAHVTRLPRPMSVAEMRAALADKEALRKRMVDEVEEYSKNLRLIDHINDEGFPGWG